MTLTQWTPPICKLATLLPYVNKIQIFAPHQFPLRLQLERGHDVDGDDGGDDDGRLPGAAFEPPRRRRRRRQRGVASLARRQRQSGESSFGWLTILNTGQTLRVSMKGNEASAELIA